VIVRGQLGYPQPPRQPPNQASRRPRIDGAAGRATVSRPPRASWADRHPGHPDPPAPRSAAPPLGPPVATQTPWTADPPPHQDSGAALGTREQLAGYRRIHGELATLGLHLSPSTVWEIPTAAGIDPAPRRHTGPSWAQFLRHLVDGTKAYVLAVIEHASRRVRVLYATAHPVRD
jgi:hypothetical protein